ncbi:MAG: nitrogen fixation protein NifQ [Rhodocyclales bacterium]|nr:nitrogen fixation protein NifQ [Rhodocyclales bacterium]
MRRRPSGVLRLEGLIRIRHRAFAAPVGRQLPHKNSGDMKWKKFFYRQLCEAAGVLICKSPSCANCCDYSHCFGAET